MTSKKGIVTFIFGFLALVAGWPLPSWGQSDTAIKMGIAWLLAVLIELIVYLFENRKHLNVIRCRIIKRNRPIRLTVAYLFRIELNGEYLLIRRHKKDRPGFQPVGGTYKYMRDETRQFFDKLGIEPCDQIERDEDTDQDLRVVIRKRKHLGAFLKWFESRENRELDPWREFHEELVEPGFIPEEHFKHIRYCFIRKKEEYVSPSPAYPIDEYRYADIYELKLDTDAQKKAFATLRDNPNLCFANPKQIRSGSNCKGETILPHTYKILPDANNK